MIKYQDYYNQKLPMVQVLSESIQYNEITVKDNYRSIIIYEKREVGTKWKDSE